MWSPTSTRYSEIAALFAKLTEKSSVCDLGCGPCYSSINIVKNHNCKVVAVDINQDCLKIAENIITKNNISDNFDLCNIDLANISDNSIDNLLKYSTNGFDLILAEGGIASYIGIKKTIEIIKRVGKKKSIYILSLLTKNIPANHSFLEGQPHTEIPDFILNFYGVKLLKSNGRRNLHSEEEIYQAILDAGFEIELSFRSDSVAWSNYYDNLIRDFNDSKSPQLKDNTFLAKVGYAAAFFDNIGYKNVNYTNIIGRIP